MLELKTKKELADAAHTMASSYNMVFYRNQIYLPTDVETQEATGSTDPERVTWGPINADFIREFAGTQHDVLFASDGELRSFVFMLAQQARSQHETVSDLLVKTETGLSLLTADGSLTRPSGSFVPNTLVPALVTDQAHKTRVLQVIQEWVGDAEEATSLLHHLATSLAPGYSAVKYVLLLGEGRNGKSLLMKMLQAIFGFANVSTVTRQQIAEQSTVVTELNGKLLNIVFDGRAEYLRDSGTEKSLIAGEQVPIRRLYESNPTIVQTNALFVEGLNREPKSNDKSSALQKRLVRFMFPNVYDLDHGFERKMLSPESLGALLSLLIDHYVPENEVAQKLAPTKTSLELQIDHMYDNSYALQFLKYWESTDPLGANGLIGSPITSLVGPFRSWRLKENDLGSWAEPDVVAQFAPLFNTNRKSVRIDGAPRKVRVISGLKPEALAFLDSLKGDVDGGSEADSDELAAMVED